MSVPNNSNRPRRDDTKSPSSEKTEQTIAVSKFPPVLVTKDWADWSYLGFAGLLAIIGGFQVLLLWHTLGAIKRQVDLMKQQLDAAHQKERPKLRIEFEGVNLKFADSPDMVLIECKIRNYGGSVAFMVGGIYRCWVGQTSEVDAPQNKGIRMVDIPEVLIPGSPYDPVMFLPDENRVVDWTLWDRDDARIENIRRGGQSIYLSGCIVYENIFEETWTLGFKRKFTVQHFGGGFTQGQWIREGEADNYEHQGNRLT